MFEYVFLEAIKQKKHQFEIYIFDCDKAKKKASLALHTI
jgi:hypothetical protein